jgi:hypothetical protein
MKARLKEDGAGHEGNVETLRFARPPKRKPEFTGLKRHKQQLRGY